MSIQGLTGADLGQGAGLGNMAKQLGGAVGLALIGTHISGAQAMYQSQLSSDINIYSNNSCEAMQNVSHLLQNSGASPSMADNVCNSLLGTEVLRNSELLSYLSSFRMLAVISLISLFFMFFLKKRVATSSKESEQ